jgi:hypothetical protein
MSADITLCPPFRKTSIEVASIKTLTVTAAEKLHGAV